MDSLIREFSAIQAMVRYNRQLERKPVKREFPRTSGFMMIDIVYYSRYKFVTCFIK